MNPMDLTHIKGLLAKHYNVHGPEISSMEGYESRNLKISCARGTYVLKTYPYTPQKEQELHGEDTVLTLLKNISEKAFPKVVPTNGMAYTLKDGNSLYRLLTFLPGKFLGNVPHTTKLWASLGRFLAQMDLALSTAYHAGIMAKETQWDLRHFAKNLQYLPFIDNASDQSLVRYFFLQFQENVAPKAHQLRQGIIHNDGNDWNVLTANGKVSGIIDFGDMCHSWTINELAVALTYALMGKTDPLVTAKPLIRAYHKSFPLLEAELEVLYFLIAARLCTSVCNSAFAKKQRPESDYITISEKPAWELLRTWLTINPIKAQDEFRKAAGFAPLEKPKAREQLRLRNGFLGKSLSVSYDRPIQMHRSAFQYMYNAQGHTFLDAYNNIMLAGHCHPHVVSEGQQTMARLNTNTRYLYPEILGYSQQLLQKFPKELNKVFYVNSGSAATDLAIRLAMARTQKKKIMVLEHGYHGNTRTGMAISAYKYNHKKGQGRQAHIIQAAMPKVFGSPFADDGTAGAHFAHLAKEQIAEHKNTVAAFIAEPIIGCGGQVPLPKGYLQEIYPQIRAQGGVCISDEVQVGFGRLGTSFWGFENYGVVPDIVILGKPMGNGHPMGAVVTTTEIAEDFAAGPEFFSSFGGNPVSCAIGKAVLEVIESENLQQKALKTGTYLMDRLKELSRSFPSIADVRGSGLFIGVEITDENQLPDTVKAAYLKNGLRQMHVLVGTDGPRNNVIKIKPPLCFNKDNADELINKFQKLLRNK